MTRVLILCAGILFSLQVASADLPSAEVEPEFIEKQLRSKKGVERWVIDHEGTNLKSFRASRIIELNDPYAFVALALDYDAMSRWMHMMSTSEELKNVSNLKKHGRVVSKVPWPFMDREALAVGTILPQKNNLAVEFFYESAPDLLPPTKGVLRIEEFVGHITLELIEGKKARLTMEATVDPGGNIPKFLVHMMMRDVPYYSLMKLERLMNTQEYLGKKAEYPEVNFPESW